MNRVLIKSSAISFESKTTEYKSEHIKEDTKSVKGETLDTGLLTRLMGNRLKTIRSL